MLDILYEIRKQNSDYQPKILEEENRIISQIQLNITSFSDHIIISLPINFLQFSENVDKTRAFSILFMSITFRVNSFYNLALRNGIIFRGAVTIGDIYFDRANNIAASIPLTEAIEDEAKTAIYPRVIVSKPLLDYIKTLQPSLIENKICMDLRKDFRCYIDLQKDFDGMHYIDYMPFVFQEFTRDSNAAISLFEHLREKICENIDKYCDKNNILQKWYWLASYFDKSLEDWKKNNLEYFKREVKNGEKLADIKTILR